MINDGREIETNVAEMLSKEWSTLQGAKIESRSGGEGSVMIKGRNNESKKKGSPEQLPLAALGFH